MKNLLFSLFIVLVFVNVANAQKPYWELGFGTGISSYWGDLNSESFSDNFMNMNIAGNIHMRYNIGNFAARGMLTIGKLKGSDANSLDDARRMRNLSFFSPLSEFAVIGEYNIFGFDPTDNESIFSPYVLAGAGVLRFDPQTEYNGQNVHLQPLGTEGQGIDGFGQKYSLTQFVIPMGGGIKFKLSRNLVGSLEMIGRATFTDYLDDVSTRYVNYEELLTNNGELSANVSQRIDEYLGLPEGSNADITNGATRGGAEVNDYYFTLMINLSYNLGRKLVLGGRSSRKGASCPKF